MSAEETFATFRRFWLKHHDAVEVFVKDQSTAFASECGNTLAKRSDRTSWRIVQTGTRDSTQL